MIPLKTIRYYNIGVISGEDIKYGIRHRINTIFALCWIENQKDKLR
jgi:hypothetical protein